MPKQDRAAPAANRKTPPANTAIPAQHLLEAGGLLRLPQVVALVGVSKSHWWALVRAGRAPAAVRIGTRCTAWRAADVAAWIEAAGKPEAQA